MMTQSERVERLAAILAEHECWEHPGWRAEDRWGKTTRDDAWRAKMIRIDTNCAPIGPSTSPHWVVLAAAIAEVESGEVFGRRDRCAVCGHPDARETRHVATGANGSVAVCVCGGVCAYYVATAKDQMEGDPDRMAARTILRARRLYREQKAKPTPSVSYSVHRGDGVPLNSRQLWGTMVCPPGPTVEQETAWGLWRVRPPRIQASRRVEADFLRGMPFNPHPAQAFRAIMRDTCAREDCIWRHGNGRACPPCSGWRQVETWTPKPREGHRCVTCDHNSDASSHICVDCYEKRLWTPKPTPPAPERGKAAICKTCAHRGLRCPNEITLPMPQCWKCSDSRSAQEQVLRAMGRWAARTTADAFKDAAQRGTRMPASEAVPIGRNVYGSQAKDWPTCGNCARRDAYEWGERCPGCVGGSGWTPRWHFNCSGKIVYDRPPPHLRKSGPVSGNPRGDEWLRDVWRKEEAETTARREFCALRSEVDSIRAGQAAELERIRECDGRIDALDFQAQAFEGRIKELEGRLWVGESATKPQPKRARKGAKR